MYRKRIVRITLFVILNLAILFGLGVLIAMLTMKGDCVGCYHLVSSGSPDEAKKNGTWVSSYHIISSDFVSSDSNLKNTILKTKFWVEHLKMVPNDGGTEYKYVWMIWSKKNRDIKFKRFSDSSLSDDVNYWNAEKTLPDTITIEVFHREPVIQGKFAFIKKNN